MGVLVVLEPTRFPGSGMGRREAVRQHRQLGAKRKFASFIDSTYGPLIWVPICFFLVWVEFKVWALVLGWYRAGF